MKALVALILTFTIISSASSLPQARPVEFPKIPSVKCDACEVFFWALLQVLPANRTSDAIETALQDLCNASLPNNLAALCDEVFDDIPFQNILSTVVWFLGSRDYHPFELCGFFSICKTKCCLDPFAPEQTHLSLTSIPDELSVMWVSYNGSNPIVRYGLSPNLTLSSPAVTTTYTAGGWVGLIHTAILTNLKPDTKYYYQVGDLQHSFTPIYWFRTYTATPRPTLVAHVADFGSGPIGNLTRKALAKLIGTGKVDLLVHSGDIAYADGVEYIWDDYFRECESFLPYVPYMASPGNHEILYAFDAFLHRFNFPHQASGSPSNLFYSFDFGWVHFVTFNADGPVTKDFNFPTFPPAEIAWLKGDLAKANQNRATVPWIIFVTHRNLYCYAAEDGLYDCTLNTQIGRLYLEDILYNAKVDLLLTGHLHSYQRMWPTYNSTSVKNYTNPPYPVQVVNGWPGNREGFAPFPTPYEPPEWLAFGTLEMGYGLLSIDSPSQLTWRYVSSLNGSVLDSFVLTQERSASP